MLRYVCDDLSDKTKIALARLQHQIDELPSHAERCAKAKALFERKPTKAFNEVRSKLARVSPPGDSCFYCERDRYRDIDHIRPKRHYPEQCFAWENYVYSCTICNQDAKRDTYAVFDINGAIVKFDRSLPITDSIPVGEHVLIDPRSEDPLEFLQLDLETGRFVAIGDERARKRGEFTRDLFQLNDSSLARIRVQAYGAFTSYLEKHSSAINAGDNAQAALILEEVRNLPHPTVLVEMRRQRFLIKTLKNLFQGVPDDIGARCRQAPS